MWTYARVGSPGRWMVEHGDSVLWLLPVMLLCLRLMLSIFGDDSLLAILNCRVCPDNSMQHSWITPIVYPYSDDIYILIQCNDMYIYIYVTYIELYIVYTCWHKLMCIEYGRLIRVCRPRGLRAPTPMLWSWWRVWRAMIPRLGHPICSWVGSG